MTVLIENKDVYHSEILDNTYFADDLGKPEKFKFKMTSGKSANMILETQNQKYDCAHYISDDKEIFVIIFNKNHS